MEQSENKMITRAEQLKKPNFEEDGKLYLVRCFNCGNSERGRENWAMLVASGSCAWCGWNEKDAE